MSSSIVRPNVSIGTGRLGEPTSVEFDRVRGSRLDVEDAPREVSGMATVDPMLQAGLHRAEVVRAHALGDLFLPALGLGEHPAIVRSELWRVVLEGHRGHAERVELAFVEVRRSHRIEVEPA